MVLDVGVHRCSGAQEVQSPIIGEVPPEGVCRIGEHGEKPEQVSNQISDRKIKILPKSEKMVFSMPRASCGLFTLLIDDINYDDSLSGGKEDDGEGSGIFDSVEQGFLTLIRRKVIFDKALS